MSVMKNVHLVIHYSRWDLIMSLEADLSSSWQQKDGLLVTSAVVYPGFLFVYLSSDLK